MFGATAAWVGGGIACVVIVLLLSAAYPALVRYRTSGVPREPENPLDAAPDAR